MRADEGGDAHRNGGQRSVRGTVTETVHQAVKAIERDPRQQHAAATPEVRLQLGIRSTQTWQPRG